MAEPVEPDPNCPSCAVLVKELRKLQGTVEKLGLKIERLEARKPKTSRTSSKPPSTDGPWAKGKGSKKPPSGKNRGGQPGHEGKSRKPTPPEDVDEMNSVRPDTCSSCSQPLVGEDPDPRCHQIIDIPPVKPTVTEYRLHALECSGCGHTTKAGLPEGVHESSFGPNLAAFIVLLTGEYRMSRRNIQRLIADSYGIEISLGAISNIERRMTEGLATAHVEAMASVAQSATKHLDETSWRESGERSWVWAAVGEEATAFVIRSSRGSEVARELIGDDPTGTVITDRYSGYSYIDLDQRQVCFAHLIRDFRGIAEGEWQLCWIGDRLLALTGALFRIWRMHGAEEINRTTLWRWARPIRTRMVDLLEQGAASDGYETPGKCRGILRTESAMWTFLEREGVEPTNNVAERAVRPVVIHRKTSYGSQSEGGSRYIERMQTCSATLRQAGKNVCGFITDVAHAVLAGGPAPKLIP